MIRAEEEEEDAGVAAVSANDDMRIILSSQRTMLSWIRTGLAMMAFGFVVARFGIYLHETRDGATSQDPRLSLWFGIALLMLGIAVNALAFLEHVLLSRRLNRGEHVIASGTFLSIFLAITLSVLGAAMILYLVNLR